MLYDFPQPTPMIMVLGTHFTRASDVIVPDFLTTDPAVPITPYRDLFGNWCSRIVAPAGRMRLAADGVVRDSGLPDPVFPRPLSMRSRTCPPIRWSICSAAAIARPTVFPTSPGNCSRTLRQAGRGCRRSAISSIVTSRSAMSTPAPPRPRSEAYNEGKGVCRDYAHLAIAFCRCMNIPARYCTGYLGDIGTPQPWAAGDFAGWFEAYLGGRWHTFDPRNNVPRIGRVLIAQGRDASDVPITQTFGPNTLVSFKVWTDEVA